MSRQSFIVKLLFLILLFIGGLILTTGFTYLWNIWYGIEGMDLFSTQVEGQGSGYVRGLAAINNGFTFAFPAIIFALVVYGAMWREEMDWVQWPRAEEFGWSVVFVLGAMMLSQWLYLINQLLPLPDLLTSIEEDTAELIRKILIINDLGDLFLTLFVVAVVPAVGEELIFRGLMQRKLHKLTVPWKAILVTSLVFSFIHFQFEGFLPRAFLGAVLGVLYYWSGKLWLPIIAHFLVNGSQVILAYILGYDMLDNNIEELASLKDWQTWFVALIAGLALYRSGKNLFLLSDKNQNIE